MNFSEFAAMKNRLLLRNTLPYLTVLLLCGILFLPSCTQKATDATSNQIDSSKVNPNQPGEKSEPVSDSDVKITKGTFVSMEWGDYLHFNMKNEAGEEISFFVFDLPEDQITAFEKPEMAGKAIEVKWKTSKRDIPESGGEMELDEILDVQLIK